MATKAGKARKVVETFLAHLGGKNVPPGRSGGCPPELPQIRTCPIKASGSSSHGLTTDGGAPARGTGNGKWCISSVNRAQLTEPLR
jgi:hypothetical protein